MVDQASGQSPIRSPVKEGFEEVDVRGSAGERKSVESSKAIMREDQNSHVPGSFDEEANGVPEIVEPEVKGEEHNKSVVEHVVPEPTMKAEHEELTAMPELKREVSEDMIADNDTFHSIPTTPMDTISLADEK